MEIPGRLRLDDGKYNLEFPSCEFPEYILDDAHPFTKCLSLQYKVNNTISNNFSGQDSPENLSRVLKTAPSDWHYRTKKIEYIVNSSGYRTREWKDINWKTAIVLLGCSNTFGVGVNEDETISSHLEKSTGRQVINLGFPSGSNELILNIGATMIEKFGVPYGVVINWSSIDRLRYYSNVGPTEVGSWTPSPSPAADLWRASIKEERNLLSKQFYIGKVARSMFLNRSKYITLSQFPNAAHYLRADFFVAIDGKARDTIHPGPQATLEIAKILHERLK